VKHLVIFISIFIFSSLLVSCEKNGPGTETYEDGSSYVGVFEDGKYHGQGTYTSPDGSRYEGKWKGGKKQGQGTYTFPDGSKYVGKFRGNKPGDITFYNKDGNNIGKLVYLYQRKVNGKWGWHKEREREDNEYLGQTENGKPNGHGVLTRTSGSKYVGDWKDGEFHGQGTYTLIDGSKYVGEFRGNEVWEITFYDKNGKDLGEIWGYTHLD